MALHDGDQVADRYQLVNRIAVGGMGEVWEARDLRLGRTVAIKVLKPEIGSDPDFLARFRTEAQIAASLNHRGIAGVHDYGEGVTPDGTPTAYLVMELVRGEPLSARLANRGKLGPVLTLDLLEQTGRGLYAAHTRDFVHRDVKPGNILLSEDGTVKLTDFGIAKALTAAPVTESGMVMGTAHYIAPEQARGEDASPASDVYSLAVVGYECLVGQRPFQAPSPVEVAMMHIHDPVPPLPDDIPPNVRKLIEIGLAKDPQQRYRSGGEFAAAVALVRRGQPPPTPGSVVVQSTSGALPAVGTLPEDRAATSPSADGLALSGLAAPGLPPLPGSQKPGNQRTGSQKAGPQKDGARKDGAQGAGTQGTAARSTGPQRKGTQSTGTQGSQQVGSQGSGGQNKVDQTGTGQRGVTHSGGTSQVGGVRGSGGQPPVAASGQYTWTSASVPPVQGSGGMRPVERTGPEQRRFTPPPSPARSGRVLLLATFVLLTVAAVAIGVYVVRSAVRPEAPARASRVPAASSAPAVPGAPGNPAPGGTALSNTNVSATISVELTSYTGRAADAVETELRGAGLTPRVVNATGNAPTNPANCTVTGLRPSGTLAKGTAVTITCVQH